MKRAKAVDIVRQILENCSYVKSITLLRQPRDGMSDNYKIRIDGLDELHLCVESIASENGLIIEKTDNSLTIDESVAREYKQPRSTHVDVT